MYVSSKCIAALCTGEIWPLSHLIFMAEIAYPKAKDAEGARRSAKSRYGSEVEFLCLFTSPKTWPALLPPVCIFSCSYRISSTLKSTSKGPWF